MEEANDIGQWGWRWGNAAVDTGTEQDAGTVLDTTETGQDTGWTEKDE